MASLSRSVTLHNFYKAHDENPTVSTLGGVTSDFYNHYDEKSDTTDLLPQTSVINSDRRCSAIKENVSSCRCLDNYKDTVKTSPEGRPNTIHFMKETFSDVFNLQRLFHKKSMKGPKSKKQNAKMMKHSISECDSIAQLKLKHTAIINTLQELNKIDEKESLEKQEGSDSNIEIDSSSVKPTQETLSMPQHQPPTSLMGDGDGSMSFTTWFQIFLLKKRSRRNIDLHRSATSMQPVSMIRTSASLSVVYEAQTLGSDGESLDVSPCTSDQAPTSAFYQNLHNDTQQRCYVPNVKMRQKQSNRRWSEQDIQKRLSLPADIKLPQTVVEKLNRTPTLDNPLTRKSRRASLSEIGFGKLETYKKLLDLGEGTYATVYLGKSLLTGKSVALKEIRLNHEEGAPCTAIREVSLLRNLRHANVVTLHDVIYTERILTLVFEFVEHDLREYMEEVDGFICMNNVKLFMIQLLRGLAYCHKRRILHRDLKPQNLLINRVGELKLADFGLARAQSVPTKTYSNEVVTLWYRPPDVLLGSTDYSTHIDMWGIGCIFYELLMHKPLFSGSTTDEQLNLIFQRFGTPTMEYDSALCALPLFKLFHFKKYPYPTNFHLKLYNPPRVTAECTELLQKLLRYDGRLRISALEGMRASFFQDFPQAEIFRLSDTDSVLSLPGVSYVPELNTRRNPAPC